MRHVFSILSILIMFTSCQKDFNPISYNDDFDHAICYSKLIGHNWEIVLNNLEGNTLKNISNNKDGDYSPAWSPDGRYIAFRHDKSIGGSDIYLYDVSKNELTNVTHDLDSNVSADQPFWTPDGEKIFFSYHKLGEQKCIFIMNKDGTNKQRLLDDGKLIDFYNDSYHFIYENDDFVFKTNIDGNVSELILNKINLGKSSSFFIADFNPNTEELLFRINGDWGSEIDANLLRYNIKKKEIDTLLVSETGWYYHSVTYSNDYSKIAFIETKYGDWIDKLAILENSNKRELVCLTNGKESVDYNPIVFSPGDTYLAYSKNIKQEGPWYWWKSYLNTVNIETKEVKFIDEGTNPQWNPLLSF